MVGAYGGSADELATAAVEQSAVAACAGANQQRIGVGNACGCELVGLEVMHLGIRFNQTFYVGYVAFNKYFHSKQCGVLEIK